MSNHICEVDDLDFILRDALRSNKDTVPDPARVFAPLRARIVADLWPAPIRWLLPTPVCTSYHSASYWYLAPLSRLIH